MKTDFQQEIQQEIEEWADLADILASKNGGDHYMIRTLLTEKKHKTELLFKALGDFIKSEEK